MVRETDAIDDLGIFGRIPGMASIQAVRELMEEVGPEMPDNLQATRKPSQLPGNPELMLYNHDEGHAGRFSVPGEKTGASLAFDFVLKQDDPFQYIMKNIAFRNEGSKLEGDTKEDEVVVFVPGLNTVHQPMEGETTTWQSLQYYIKVLNIPMAQMHIGSSFDQGQVRVDSSRAGIFRTLMLGLGSKLPDSVKPKEDGDDIVWEGRQIDNIQAALSQFNLWDTPVKEHIRELLDTTNDNNGKPFVLMVYSRGAIECEAALRKYIDDKTKGFFRGQSHEEIEQRLRERVTVVTIGAASHDWPDGPAYIHVAAWTDPLSSTLGITERNNAKDGGEKAVILNCESPYDSESFDNHNFGAVTSQFLALVMGASKATGLRDLWEKAQDGKMVVPADSDNLVKAMIQLTRGFELLWDVRKAWKRNPMESVLPTTSNAEATLRARMGDTFVDQIKRNISTI